MSLDAASIIGGGAAVIEIVKKLAEIFPQIKAPFAAFWGAQNLGPLPPDMALWSDVDAAVDADLEVLKADAAPATTPTGDAPR